MIDSQRRGAFSFFHSRCRRGRRRWWGSALRKSWRTAEGLRGPSIRLLRRLPFDTATYGRLLRTKLRTGRGQGAGGEDRAGERENPPTRRALRRAGGRGGEVAGIWSVTISYPVADVDHVLTLEQEGAKIAGVHRTLFQENALRGEVEGRRVRLVSEHRYEGTHLVYTFEGEADGDEMAGRVEVGSEGQSAPGPLNRKEYGSYEWKAGRQ